MEKITATRALNELKLLDKRIAKKINGSCFINFQIGDQIQKENCDPVADFQSVTDLINRRDTIKAALMVSNSVTKIIINDEEMSVAEAIEKKNSIGYLKKLLVSLKHQYMAAVDDIERENAEAQERLDRLLEANFGKDMKARENELEAVSKAFWETNKAKKIDDLHIQTKIDELDEYIDRFESEVDLVLSETNARTEISI
jgi:hypothetical protein